MKILGLMCFFYLLIFQLEAREIDSLFKALDKSISERQKYRSIKEDKLKQLKKELTLVSELDQKFDLSKKLMSEYSYYMNDSALYYVDNCLKLAHQMGDDNFIKEIQMENALLLCFEGLFHDSFKIMESINPDSLSLKLRDKYYRVYTQVYHNQIKSILFSPYQEKYKNEALQCIEQYLKREDVVTLQYLAIMVYKYYLEKNYKEAINTLNRIQERDDITPYEHLEAMFNLGYIFYEAGEEYAEQAEVAFIKASIQANELALTKNPPLVYLAMILVKQEKQLDRAYNYMNIASEDASRFSFQYRINNIVKIHNTIQELYLLKIKKQQLMLILLVAVLLFFCICIILFILFLYRKNVILKNIRLELSYTNEKLRDSNRIKDTYIFYFLNRYATNLDKLDGYKKHIIRQLNTYQPSEVIRKEAMVSIDTDSELNMLFSEFDKSVLELYPNFVENVNKLLKEDRKYIVNKDSKLNTELRILALLRLGIYDNKQIASFFRFTVQTVYNYRSKAKSRAIQEDTFEENIKNICTYS